MMCTASDGGPLGQLSLVVSLTSMSSPLTCSICWTVLTACAEPERWPAGASTWWPGGASTCPGGAPLGHRVKAALLLIERPLTAVLGSRRQGCLRLSCMSNRAEHRCGSVRCGVLVLQSCRSCCAVFWVSSQSTSQVQFSNSVWDCRAALCTQLKCCVIVLL